MERDSGLKLEGRLASVDVECPPERDMTRVRSVEQVAGRRGRDGLWVVRDLLAQLEDLALQLLDVALPLPGTFHEGVGRALGALGVALELHNVADCPFELFDHALDA